MHPGVRPLDPPMLLISLLLKMRWALCALLMVDFDNERNACCILILQRTFEDGCKPKGVIHHLLNTEKNARRDDGYKLITHKNVEGVTYDMLQAGNNSIFFKFTICVQEFIENRRLDLTYFCQ